MTLIQLDNVSYATPAGRILAAGVSLRLKEGEALLISGPNGAGKTTLLKIILGLQAAATGLVTTPLRPEEIVYLPQLQSVAFHLPLTLRDVLRISQRHHVPTAAMLAPGLLEERHLNLLWNTASGGEKKRCLLTRALLSQPRLLILDEPLNHLDRETRARVSTVLDEFVVHNRQAGLVMVSHEEPDFSGRFPVNRYHIEKAGQDD